jgi:curved DNA-binding protein CbpA
MSGSESTDRLVQGILDAKTLYDVLGLSPQSMDKASLRKAYLKTSVSVHPDKCSHPQATQAFQRVAEAWGTLSDDSFRAEYDAELRQNSSGSFQQHNYGNSNDTAGSTHYAQDFERAHMPSFQEALFMFATVTSMFSGAGGSGGGSGSAASTRSASVASDFLETLFWAQQLAEGRNQGNGYSNHDSQARGAGDFNDFDNDKNNTNTNNKPQSASDMAANDPLRAGMALGSGLRAIAGVQRAMGMRKSAAATEKAALGVQVAAMGATVLKNANENPAVKRTLERGQDALKNNPQLANGLRASLKMAGSVIQALQAAQQEAQQQQQQQQQPSAGTSNPRR